MHLLCPPLRSSPSPLPKDRTNRFSRFQFSQICPFPWSRKALVPVISSANPPHLGGSFEFGPLRRSCLQHCGIAFWSACLVSILMVRLGLSLHLFKGYKELRFRSPTMNLNWLLFWWEIGILLLQLDTLFSGFNACFIRRTTLKCNRFVWDQFNMLAYSDLWFCF